MKVDLRGPGGKEHEINKLFPNWERRSSERYDFIDRKTGDKIEVKKTRNVEFQVKIDLSKFTGLSDEDRAVKFVALYYDPKNGVVLDTFETTTGEIADRFITKEMDDAVQTVYKLHARTKGLYGPDLSIKLKPRSK